MREYRFALHELKLSDELSSDSNLIPVVACITGKWDHPAGELKINKEDLDHITANFKKSKKDLLFDFDHKCLDGFNCSTRAAGWGKDMRITDEGLEIDVEFTPAGLEMVKNKEYRYLSPVYLLSSKRKDRNVTLHSVALTNTPFLKELPAIINSQNNTQSKGENQMEEILKLLRCSENEAVNKIKELIKSSEELSSSVEQKNELTAKLSELETQNKELSANFDNMTGKLAENDVELAIANNQIRKDQKEFALSLRKKDFELYENFIKTNKPKANAPTTTLDVTDNTKTDTTEIKSFSELLDNPVKFKEFQEEHPDRYQELYEKFINGGE